MPSPTLPPQPSDDAELHRIRDALDHAAHAGLARLTGGLSPAAVVDAYMDWAANLAISPGKQVELAAKAARKWARLAQFASRCASGGGTCEPCIEPLPQDKRFTEAEWQQWPFNLIQQGFLLQQQWWDNATTGIDGVTKQHQAVVEFIARQILDMASPSNFLVTNPVVQRRILETGGQNLVQGFRNFLDDWERIVRSKPPAGVEAFQVGRDVAVTPGKVIYRNRLIELIQYEPTTEKVRPEPILIVPAWIMKYYILDLSPENSLVRYLTGQGFTVFIISWKNPTAEDRDLGMDDYRTLGVMAALDAVNAVVPDQKVHAVGYCLGGTLLSIAAAAMARDGDKRLETLSLLAAQADFREAGELTLFINESQVHFLEDLMRSQGYLDTRQMAGAFQLLRSNDLIWSQARAALPHGRADAPERSHGLECRRNPHAIPHACGLPEAALPRQRPRRRTLPGRRPSHRHQRHPGTDLRGRHRARSRRALALGLQDPSARRYRRDIPSHDGRPQRRHRGRTGQCEGKLPGPDEDPPRASYLDPDTWTRIAPRFEGSWWPEWARWLASHSGEPAAASRIGCTRAGLSCPV